MTLASRSLEVTVTNGVATAASAGLFVATDAGRQIRLTTLPIYTIASVTDANTVVLDRAYTEDTTTATATILDVYAVLPTNFRRFLQVYDRYNQRIIPFWLNEEQIAVADPARRISDIAPRYLVANSYSTATATLGQVRYEYWPAVTAAKTFPYLYITKAPTLNDDDALPGVLSERPDLLRLYVMYRATGWPGTVDQRNPAYDRGQSQAMKAEFEQELQSLSLADDSEYPQQLMTVDWARRLGEITATASILRQTDATTNDYW